MHSSRVIVRTPQVCRLVRAPSNVRTMSLFATPQYLPRFPGSAFPTFNTFNSEIAPLFRLMDEFAASTRSFDSWPQLQGRPIAHFQPRFDVRELSDSYELRGELPGVESEALQVEFTDAQTLVIRGSTATGGTSHAPAASETASNTLPEQTLESNMDPAPETAADAASVQSTSSYQKASVEDEGATEVSSSSSAQPTPPESTISANAQQPKASIVEQQSAKETSNEQPKYWISERSTGSFQRVFSFPSRVNQEAVRASLKNGILNITVPKSSPPTSRRINIE